MMRRFLALFVVLGMMVPAAASAEVKIGIAMAKLNQGFLTLLHDALVEHANSKSDMSYKLTMADGDPAKQIEKIKEFIKSGVNTIIFHPADSDMTEEVNQLAADAGVPLVYVNRTPPQLKFPGKVAIVTSNELVAGCVQMRMLASLVNGQGKMVLLHGGADHPAAKARTEGVKEILAEKPGIEVIHEPMANRDRAEAEAIMSGLLAKGARPDIIACNNDEMAIGAINAYKKARVSLDDVVIGGTDGTPAALAEIEAGTLEVSLFQMPTSRPNAPWRMPISWQPANMRSSSTGCLTS